MNASTTATRPPVTATHRSATVAYVTGGVIVAWMAFALLDDLEPNGRHLLVLGALRVVLFGFLLAASPILGIRSRVGRAAVGVVGLGAVINLGGGLGAVATDGWSFNPFEDAPDGAAAPWYAYLVMVGALLFVLGSVVAGMSARTSGWPAVVLILGGLAYVVAVPLGAYGHIVWLAPWLALAILVATRAARPHVSQEPSRR